MAEKKQSSPLKRFISILVTITSLGVFIYAAIGLGDAVIDYYKNRKMLSNLQDIFYEEKEDSGSGRQSIRSGFDALLGMNEDVVGWITVDGTQIDYPILQGEDNDAYLTTNFEGRESRAGSIFLDYRNDILSKDLNTVIYGHRMKDGSMFQHLNKYLDEDFFFQHRTFEYDTLFKSYEAEVFAVYPTLTDFNYIETRFDTSEEYRELIDEIKARSKFSTDIDIAEDDQIITLSTCDYMLDEDHGRLVVHAKLTEK